MILGEDHEVTLAGMDKLAWTYGLQGRLSEAAEMNEEC